MHVRDGGLPAAARWRCYATNRRRLQPPRVTPVGLGSAADYNWRTLTRRARPRRLARLAGRRRPPRLRARPGGASFRTGRSTVSSLGRRRDWKRQRALAIPTVWALQSRGTGHVCFAGAHATRDAKERRTAVYMEDFWTQALPTVPQAVCLDKYFITDIRKTFARLKWQTKAKGWNHLCIYFHLTSGYLCFFI